MAFRDVLAAAVIALSGALTACATAPAQPAAATAAVDIRGSWRSVAPEHDGSHHATRDFVIGERDWQVTYRTFADADGRQPLFTIRVHGTYVIGEASAKVAGAYEGIFAARTRSVTADSDAGVRMFAGMGCTLQQGRETMLVNTGCGFVPGTMQAMGEYDLVALRDGTLYFGDRAGDLSKARPDRLTPHPLLRVAR